MEQLYDVFVNSAEREIEVKFAGQCLKSGYGRFVRWSSGLTAEQVRTLYPLRQQGEEDTGGTWVCYSSKYPVEKGAQ